MRTRRVFKYELPLEDYVDLQIPQGSVMLHVGVQHGKLCLWALVDTDRREERHRFRIAGTGHLIEENFVQHIGSVMMAGGNLVFHVFQVSV